jgi:DNA-binding transcriptional MerR regulator
MKELVEATGVPKSTILHYVKEGLLPEPLKTSPNMAYYHPESVERVRFIKTVQSNHRLPLTKIKSLLIRRDRGEDITFRLELVRGIFGEAGGPLLDETAFAEATGLNSTRIDEFLSAGLILPLEEGRFDGEDVAMGVIYAAGLAVGVKPEDLAFYPKLGKRIVDEEMALRRRLTSRLPEEADAERTLILVRAARAARNYVIDRLFQHRVAKAGNLKDEDSLK